MNIHTLAPTAFQGKLQVIRFKKRGIKTTKKVHHGNVSFTVTIMCCRINQHRGLIFSTNEIAAPQITMREALRNVLHHHLVENEQVTLFGEDIEDPKGDVFGVTKGLSTELELAGITRARERLSTWARFAGWDMPDK